MNENIRIPLLVSFVTGLILAAAFGLAFSIVYAEESFEIDEPNQEYVKWNQYGSQIEYGG